MNNWIFRITKNKSLKIFKGEIVVSEKISTDSSIDVALLQCFIQVYCNTDVFHCFCQYSHASKCSPSCQVVNRVRFFLQLDSRSEIIDSIIKSVKLEVKEPFEKHETWFHLDLSTIFDCLFHQSFCFKNFVVLYLLVNIVTLKWVCVAAYNRYYLESIGIFVWRENLLRLLKYLIAIRKSSWSILKIPLLKYLF